MLATASVSAASTFGAVPKEGSIGVQPPGPFMSTSMLCASSSSSAHASSCESVACRHPIRQLAEALTHHAKQQLRPRLGADLRVDPRGGPRVSPGAALHSVFEPCGERAAQGRLCLARQSFDQCVERTSDLMFRTTVLEAEQRSDPVSIAIGRIDQVLLINEQIANLRQIALQRTRRFVNEGSEVASGLPARGAVVQHDVRKRRSLLTYELLALSSSCVTRSLRANEQQVAHHLLMREQQLAGGIVTGHCASMTVAAGCRDREAKLCLRLALRRAQQADAIKRSRVTLVLHVDWTECGRRRAVVRGGFV